MKSRNNFYPPIQILVFGLLLFGTLLMIPSSLFAQHDHHQSAQAQPDISHYTCGMHPSVVISPEEYNKGNNICPICKMSLTTIYKEEPQEKEDLDDHVVSRVRIKTRETQLAGVESQRIVKQHLTKSIRTVGKVAYDPDLAVAQDEFIAALRANDKIKQGDITGVSQRAKTLIESSRRKLHLLGMSEEQIKELNKMRKSQTSLILPEEAMWIYGEVYEYELSWVKKGVPITVTASAFPGDEFKGAVRSIDSVVNPKTRSIKFRAQVNNPGLKLKPDMYVDIVINSMYLGPEGEHMVLAIPKEAVLDTGTRKIVWVDKGKGQYEGREVIIGQEASLIEDGKKIKFYPLLKGLAEGDKIVTKGNFLIDSQSQITGVAGSAYSGALETEKSTSPKAHQH